MGDAVMNIDDLKRAALALPRADRASLRGALSSSLARPHGSGRQPTCVCGSCKTCRKREQQRKFRAKQKEMGK